MLVAELGVGIVARDELEEVRVPDTVCTSSELIVHSFEDSDLHAYVHACEADHV